MRLPAREQVATLGLGFHLAHEVEVGAVLERMEDRARLRPVVGEQHGGGQVARVGIDREAEEQHLDHRNAEHHREGEPVAAHLREFLHDHRPKPPLGKWNARAHAGEKLSLDCSMRWMKTSSSPERICVHS